jgi:hypothetical protein
MNTKLNNNDYINILKYYNIPIPKTNAQLKLQAEHVMSNYLCRCITTVDIKDKRKYLQICKNKTLKKRFYFLK